MFTARLVLSVLLVMGSVGALAQADKAERYLENIRSGSVSLRMETCKKIHNYSGITDRRIFDLLEEKVLFSAKKEKPNRQEKNEAVWMIRALASSGSDRYLPTLKVIANNKSVKRKIRKAAEEALTELPRFARWNPVINSDDHEMSGRKNSLALWMRMVDSGDAEMALRAVEKAQEFAVYDVNFMVLLEDKIRANYLQKSDDEYQLEFQGAAMQYFMSHPEYGKYTALVNEVAEKSPNKAVRKAARKAL